MSDTAAPPEQQKERSFFPIIILVVVMAAIGWMCSDSFRSRLSDSALRAALEEGATTTQAQHATEELTQRIVAEKDKGLPPKEAPVTSFYPGLIKMAASSDPEKRKAAAWAMQYDRTEPSFHEPLVRLLADQDPYVNRNAATSLAVRGSAAGRDVLLSMLAPFEVRSPVEGVTEMALASGDPIAAGHRVARIKTSKGEAEVLSPLDGRVVKSIPTGQKVAEGALSPAFSPSRAPSMPCKR